MNDMRQRTIDETRTCPGQALFQLLKSASDIGGEALFLELDRHPDPQLTSTPTSS